MHERKCLTTRFEKRVKEPITSLETMESKMKKLHENIQETRIY